MLRQIINLVAFVATPGKVVLLELFLPAVWSVGLLVGFGQQVGSWASPVLLPFVLLALCDRSRHRTLALVDIANVHPLPVDGLLPQGHLIVLPEAARMLALMDQLTCHTISLNWCSSLGDRVLLEVSSQVQMNTQLSSLNSWQWCWWAANGEGPGHISNPVTVHF